MKSIVIATLLFSLGSFAGSQRNVLDGQPYTEAGIIVEGGEDYFVMERTDSDLLADRIIVEVDGWNSDRDFHYSIGDEVIVYGKVDQDAFERFKIEAGRVYFPLKNKTFISNSTDEEFNTGPYGHVNTIPDFKHKTEQVFTGQVKRFNDNGFELKTKDGVKLVDTSAVNVDPVEIDRIDFVQGDYVRVYGILNENIFTKDEIEANRVFKVY